MQLQPWPAIKTRQRSMFTYNLAIVPAESIPAEVRQRFAKRAQRAKADVTGPFFGDDLEKRRQLWPGKFPGLTPECLVFDKEGMHVQNGGISLIDGVGYKDYRFAFDMTLPKDSQGVGTWVVRARSVNDCLMFRLWCRTSPIDYPEMKEMPSPERSYLVPIVIPQRPRRPSWRRWRPPRPLMHGQTCRITVECRGDRVDLSLDGVKFHSMQVPELADGRSRLLRILAVEQGRV